jgi:hypothetical protein
MNTGDLDHNLEIKGYPGFFRIDKNVDVEKVLPKIEEKKEEIIRESRNINSSAIHGYSQFMWMNDKMFEEIRYKH